MVERGPSGPGHMRLPSPLAVYFFFSLTRLPGSQLVYGPGLTRSWLTSPEIDQVIEEAVRLVLEAHRSGEATGSRWLDTRRTSWRRGLNGDHADVPPHLFAFRAEFLGLPRSPYQSVSGTQISTASRRPVFLPKLRSTAVVIVSRSG